MSDNLGARIIGIGHNLPPKILSNSELAKMVETTDEWITTRTGIKERRIAENGVNAYELGVPAAAEALENGGVDPKNIDLILCATSTPDKMFPSTACYIQKGIGAADCPAFDLLAACSGFSYGLRVADSFIRSGFAKNVLLVASEIYNKIINWEDRSTCVLFGDGAAAVVMTASDGRSGVIDSIIHADGRFADLLHAGGIDGRSPDTKSPSENSSYYLAMKGKETFKVAVKKMSDVSEKILKNNGLTSDDLSLVIPHQANIRIIRAVGKNLGVKEEKIFVNVHKYGNTSAASVPLALYEAQDEGRLTRGDIILLVTFGGGLTWGATLMKW